MYPDVLGTKCKKRRAYKLTSKKKKTMMDIQADIHLEWKSGKIVH